MEVGLAGNLGKGNPGVVIPADDPKKRDRAMKALCSLAPGKALLFRSLA
jgi:hypothetical protein